MRWFPATTCTSRGGSAARSVVAEKGGSVVGVAGAADLALRSCAGAAGALIVGAIVLLFLLRNAASCASGLGGNQKSQSFRTTATNAASNIPSAMTMRLRWT